MVVNLLAALLASAASEAATAAPAASPPADRPPASTADPAENPATADLLSGAYRWDDGGAGDALVAVAFPGSRRDIDRKRIGLFGVSQGGWIGPLAAPRSRRVALVVSVSGPGVTPAEQTLDLIEAEMRIDGVPDDGVSEALARGGHRDHALVVVPGANHLMFEAKTGSMFEIPALDGFAPGYRSTVLEWFEGRLGHGS